MKKGLILTVGNFGCLDGDEVESFLVYDICFGCYTHLSCESTGRQIYDGHAYCDNCYYEKLSSSIVDSMLEELNQDRKKSGLVVQLTA